MIFDATKYASNKIAQTRLFLYMPRVSPRINTTSNSCHAVNPIRLTPKIARSVTTQVMPAEISPAIQAFRIFFKVGSGTETSTCVKSTLEPGGAYGLWDITELAYSEASNPPVNSCQSQTALA